MSFYNNYPEFFETSNTGAFPNRLNYRSKVLIENNTDVIAGKNILDIASHDGRFSFSAIKNGANHVLGIEGRKELVERAIKTMNKYNIPKEKYTFVVGDIHKEIMKIHSNSIDTVFCFGFFYHTINHFTLLSEIKRINAKCLILDTAVADSYQPIIKVKYDDATKESKAIRDSSNANNRMVVGHPSKLAIEMMLKSLGFDFVYLDWENSDISDWNELSMYSTKHVPFKKKLSQFITKIKNPNFIQTNKRISIKAFRDI